MADEPTIENAIAENAKGPKRARGDAGEVEQHPISDQIAAAKFLRADQAVKRKGFGLRRAKISPPGTV